VTAGTIFAGTRTPLRTWFAAAWHVTNQKHGVSRPAADPLPDPPPTCLRAPHHEVSPSYSRIWV